MKELAKMIIRSQGVITGVQPKISLGIKKAMRKKQSRLTLMIGDYILKPPSEHYTQMPETEDLTMHLAEICENTWTQGGETASASLRTLRRQPCRTSL